MTNYSVIAFSPDMAAIRRYLEAVYTRTGGEDRVLLHVEGWLTVETVEGERQVLPAVLDSTGKLVPAQSLGREGWELIIEPTRIFYPESSQS